MSLKQRYMAAIGLDIFFSLMTVYAFVTVGRAAWGLLIQLTGQQLWIVAQVLEVGVPLVAVGYFVFSEFKGQTFGKHIAGINSYGVKTGFKMVYHETVETMVSNIRIKRV